MLYAYATRGFLKYSARPIVTEDNECVFRAADVWSKADHRVLEAAAWNLSLPESRSAYLRRRA
jgi:hypothetical protein